MPNISLIISTYNREAFIGEAIQSVLDQTYRPIEILIVDDGATDRTEQVVCGFSSPFPIRYHWQPNQWQASALNHGVSLAQGDWVAFLDSDDMWCPHKLCGPGQPHANPSRLPPIAVSSPVVLEKLARWVISGLPFTRDRYVQHLIEGSRSHGKKPRENQAISQEV